MEARIAYCGLVCHICRPDGGCDCRGENHCGKRMAPDGCFQYNCCREKGLEGCWECEDAPCGQDMLAPGRHKLRAFVSCLKEDGVDKFSAYIAQNAADGVVYHREGIFGDYDLDSEEAVLQLLRKGPKA